MSKTKKVDLPPIDKIKEVLSAYLTDDVDADFMVSSSGKYTVKSPGGFRKRLVRSGVHVRLIDVYEGKREPVIWVFEPGDSSTPGEKLELPDRQAGNALAGFRDFSKAIMKQARDLTDKAGSPALAVDDEEKETLTARKMAEEHENNPMFGSWYALSL